MTKRIARHLQTQLRSVARAAPRRLMALTLCASIGSVGCDAGDEPSGEPEFGLGGKADGTCSPSADLCWDSDDGDTMKALLLKEDDVRLGVATRSSLQLVIDLARGLDHKMTDKEADALDGFADRVDALPEEPDLDEAVALLDELEATSLHRVVGAYYAANMIPVGQMIDRGGKADDVDLGDEDAEAIDGLSGGMEESLQLLRDSGAIGVAIAQMYKMAGVLEKDYEMINAVNFGEFDAVTGRIVPGGMSREAKVKEIIRKYRRAAGFVGAGSGAVGLIPIAGIALSISAETFALFKLHAQMSFEIAAVYGWDIREGNNLYLMSTMFMTDGLLTEVGDVLASNVLIPLLAKKLATKLGVELSTNLAQQISQRSIQGLLKFFTKKAQEKLAQEAIKGATKGVASQLLGWATLGLTVFASAAIDWVATDKLGDHVAVVSRKWLHDLLMEGTTYLSMGQARDCAFRGLSAMAWQDGEVSEREQLLYQAFLAKPYSVDESNWFFLGSDERVRQSQVLRDFPSDDSTGSVESCLSDQFEDSLAQHRISLLGHLYAMMQVDQREHTDEAEFYGELRDGLDGSGFFDGDAIDNQQMDYVQKAVFMVVNPNAIEVSEEFQETTAAIAPEEVLDFMKDPHAETQADFNCGFAGECAG